MEKLKYIIDKHGNFAIFSTLATHASVARGFDTHNEIVGAGFCNIAVGYKNNPFDVSFDQAKEEKEIVNVHCWGESVSLNIKSREEDEQIINRKLNNQEY